MCYDVTCRYGAGAGNTGLSCAVSCCCCDEPDIVEPAAWHLNLLHTRLARDGNDGLKLGATDSAHRDGLHWFNILKMFEFEREGIKKTKKSSKFKSERRVPCNYLIVFASPEPAPPSGVCPSYLCCLAGGHFDWRYWRGLLNRQELLAKRHVDRKCYRFLRGIGGRGSHRHHSDLGRRTKHSGMYPNKVSRICDKCQF